MIKVFFVKIQTNMINLQHTIIYYTMCCDFLYMLHRILHLLKNTSIIEFTYEAIKLLYAKKIYDSLDTHKISLNRDSFLTSLRN